MGFVGFLPFRLCCARRCRLKGLVVVLVLRTMFVPSEVVVGRFLWWLFIKC